MMSTHQESVRVLCSDLAHHIGEEVAVSGWVHNIRKMGSRLSFVQLRDRSGIVQCVLEGNLLAQPLTVESVVRLNLVWWARTYQP